jgi:hypothetical protein
VCVGRHSTDRALQRTSYHHTRQTRPLYRACGIHSPLTLSYRPPQGGYISGQGSSYYEINYGDYSAVYNHNEYVNHTELRDHLRDVDNLDFRPLPYSSFIDAGIEVPPLNDGEWAGDAPDIGAVSNIGST